jgi:hypothetical protein
MLSDTLSLKAIQGLLETDLRTIERQLAKRPQKPLEEAPGKEWQAYFSGKDDLQDYLPEHVRDRIKTMLGHARWIQKTMKIVEETGKWPTRS